MARNEVERPPEPVKSPELTERRYIYNGDAPAPSVVRPETAAGGNRSVRRRRRSPISIMAMLVVFSLLIVFYVWNKITVNRLVVEVNDRQNQYARILNATEFLRAEINKKSSLERIGKIATEQLGLIYPNEQPVWFDVDRAQLEAISAPQAERRSVSDVRSHPEN